MPSIPGTRWAVAAVVGGLILVACGSAQSPPTATPSATATATATATEAPTRTPTVTATPTPDPRVELAEGVFERIQKTRNAVNGLQLELRDLARGRIEDDDRWDIVLAICGDVSPFGNKIYLDLWPGAYRDLDTSLAASCLLVEQQLDDHPTPTAANVDWVAVAIVVLDNLDEGEDALPDWSDAQLKRAIIDRQ